MKPTVYVPLDDGRWVDENFARLAELISIYDHNLELRWIPEDRRTREDKEPYVVVDTLTESPVMYASAHTPPQKILARLFMADNAKGNTLTKLEAEEVAKKAFQQKEWLERMAEAAEQAEFFFKTNKNTFTMNGKKFVDKRVVGPAVDRTYIA